MNSLILFIYIFQSAFVSTTPKSVAIFEYRAGVSEQSDLSARVASLIQDKTNLKAVSLRDARRKLGTTLDARIAACKDNTSCYSALGKKLKVDEIILIGMTELGTVLINFSRIIVRTSKIQGTSDLDVAMGGRITKLQIFRILTKLFPKNYFKRTGTLIVSSKVKGATISISGKKAGVTPAPPFKLPAPKRYPIEVIKKGYLPFKATIDLIPRSTMKLDAQLSPIVISSPKQQWYQKWWVWTIASGVIISAAATTYFFMQKPDSVGVELQTY
ncbi:MAG: PEGA domain-containing protein [Deltaproteobacteria bacterium]|nr:PEGA domain-containing protein [Deltaproteobacteria bacterium]